jgi:hypothetical protein
MDRDSATLNILLGVIASYIAGITSPWFVSALRYALSRVFGEAKATDITGVYDCEYKVPWKKEGENIILERIFVYKFGKKYRGYIINNRDDNNFRRVSKPTLRLEGELFVDHYLIGWWVHPLPNDNTRGAFNMKINIDGKQHVGQWNGESSTYQKILEGRWIWKRVLNYNYGISKMISQRLFGDSP